MPHTHNHRTARRRWGTFFAAIAVAFVLAFARSDNAAAHPLGNFTINQYSRIEVTTDGLRLVYILDLAEIPAFQEMREIDADGDGDLASGERAAYLDRNLTEIAPALWLTIAGEPVALRVTERSVDFPPGQAGLQLVRLRAVFIPVEDQAALSGSREISYENRYAADRLGWREIVVTHGADVAIEAATVPVTDASDELRSYPSELLADPLDLTAATFSAIPAPGEPAATEFVRFTSGASGQTGVENRQSGGIAGTRFASLLEDGNLTGTGVILALLAAMAWGAVHALSPGHGKTVVGAYLVGSRGTPKHAAFLGMTVTITHTAGVIALGLVTLFASRYVVPERIFPWLSVASGALVVSLGLFSLRRRLAGHDHHDHHRHHDHDHDHFHEHHHHDHGHSHLPPGTDGRRVTWRELLALGVSGGLIPCPSALVALLGAIALGKPGIGLALVVTFSLGLAGTLTGLGLLFLFAGRFFERRIGESGRLRLLLRYGPAIGSAALTLAGLAIVLRGLGEMGLG